MTSPTTHVHRGKGNSLYCDHCNERIRRGEAYTRQVIIHRGTPRRNDRCYVSIVHDDEETCLYWLEEEAIAEHGYAEATAEVAIAMVITSKLVARVGINGETIFTEEPCIEMKASGNAPEPAPAQDDSDDEIPF